MEFTFWFVRSFFLMLALASPILLFLSLVIFLLGSCINRLERWKMGLTGVFYYSFITATTIGYGDFCPVKKVSRMIAIGIGFIGLVMTGIVVALGIESVKLGMRHVVEDKNNSELVEHFQKKLYQGLEHPKPLQK